MNMFITIYKDSDPYKLPCTIVKTVSQASKWIGCKRDALYKSLHTNGIMKARGYCLELVKEENQH